MSNHTPHNRKVSLRLPQNTLERLERLRDHLAAHNPDILPLYDSLCPSTSAVTRLVIETGLKYLEAAAKRPPRKRPSRN